MHIYIYIHNDNLHIGTLQRLGFRCRKVARLLKRRIEGRYGPVSRGSLGNLLLLLALYVERVMGYCPCQA